MSELGSSVRWGCAVAALVVASGTSIAAQRPNHRVALIELRSRPASSPSYQARCLRLLGSAASLGGSRAVVCFYQENDKAAFRDDTALAEQRLRPASSLTSVMDWSKDVLQARETEPEWQAWQLLLQSIAEGRSLPDHQLSWVARETDPRIITGDAADLSAFRYQVQNQLLTAVETDPNDVTVNKAYLQSLLKERSQALEAAKRDGTQRTSLTMNVYRALLLMGGVLLGLVIVDIATRGIQIHRTSRRVSVTPLANLDEENLRRKIEYELHTRGRSADNRAVLATLTEERLALKTVAEIVSVDTGLSSVSDTSAELRRAVGDLGLLLGSHGVSSFRRLFELTKKLTSERDYFRGALTELARYGSADDLTGLTTEDVRARLRIKIIEFDESLKTARKLDPYAETPTAVLTRLLQLRRYYGTNLVATLAETGTEIERAKQLMDADSGTPPPSVVRTLWDRLESLSGHLKDVERQLEEGRRRVNEANEVLAIAAGRQRDGCNEAQTIAAAFVDSDAAREFIQAEWNLRAAGDLRDLIHRVSELRTEKIRQAERAGFNGQLGVETVFDTVLDELQQKRQEIESARLTEDVLRRVAGKLSTYAGFPQGLEHARLERLLDQELTGVHRDLRCRLAVGIPALRGAVDELSAAGVHHVPNLLHAGELIQGTDRFLNLLDRCTDRDTLDRSLSQAFGEQWLHFLLRAQLLVNTYFRDPRYANLVDAFNVLGGAFRRGCAWVGREFDQIELFGEPPRDFEIVRPSRELLTCPEVREQVERALGNQLSGTVVDVRTVGLTRADGTRLKSEVVLLSAAVWTRTVEV